MEVTSELVKQLRDKTGAGIMDCRNALKETSGEVGKAVDYLRKKGLATAAKKAGRSTSQGLVSSYIHAGGKIGVLLEINCETDFVAKTDEFQTFVHEIALHIAAANPQYVRREEVSEKVVEAEKEIYRAQAKESGKPDNVVDKMITGKIDKFFKDICLIEQPFVKEPDKTVKDKLSEIIAKIGENMTIRRFARFHLGEGEDAASTNGS